LQNVLHDWGDEEVLKILDNCKQSISFAHDDGKQTKAAIIEMVIDDHDRHDILATKLLCDVVMMFNLEGKERTEHEWMRLFLKAGFSRYKITRTYGLMSIIENSLRLFLQYVRPVA
ncbi:trans-resveratrol di-O-methyltransferase-like protein, partial [Tanacetum coccineum]